MDKLLFNLKYIEIIRENQLLGQSFSCAKFRLSILANVTINQIKPIYEFALRKEGINAEVEIGNYNNIVQDSYLVNECNAVIIFYDILNFFENNIFKLICLDENDLDDIEKKIICEIDIIANNLSKCPNVLFNSFDIGLITNLVDSKAPLINLVERVNKYLTANLPKNFFIVDMGFLIGRAGIMNSFSVSNFLINKSLYTVDFLKKYVSETFPILTSNNGKSKKVLLLDCDNTLWGGIIGEDGLNGIQLGTNAPKDSVYLSAHSLIKSIKGAGGLLAIVSKNNLSDVEEFFEKHKSTILKSEDFVVKKINWQNKVQNILDISSELNLGLESFVFLDDSSYEIAMVKESLPEVTCFQVPENIFDFPNTLLEVKKLFYSPSSTQEDLKKTIYYLEDTKRNKSKNNFKDVNEYLASLNLEMTIQWGKEIDTSRASQLTQKTNQFNLNSTRLTEEEIISIVNDRNYLITMISLKDKFGDYGKTGLSIIKINKQKGLAEIDNFLLSCRILGRNIEFLFLDHIIKKINNLGLLEVKSSYRPSGKNNQVSNFWQKNGFTIIKNNSDSTFYQLEIGNYVNNENINYIKINEK